MGCRVSAESVEQGRSRSAAAMGCLWKSGLGVVLAVLILLLGAAGSVESRPVKVDSRFAALQRGFPAAAGNSKMELRKLQATTMHSWGEPTPPAAKVGSGEFRSHGIKIAIVRLDDDSNARSWFRVPSPPGPGTSGTGPLDPGTEAVRTSLHVVPSGPNPLHN